MSNTHIENAIIEAIDIIADKKVAQANFDKTIKGLVNRVLDKSTGKYEIRYQDGFFTAYATSSKIIYDLQQEVLILIPGNDWDRRKTIIGGVDSQATTYQQVPLVGERYNTNGPNGAFLSEAVKLSSYAGQISKEITGISFSDIQNYVRDSDSISLGMVVKTLLADSQVGGNYGLTFNLKFYDQVDKSKEIIKSFSVDTKDVIGNPYFLTSDTLVETLITGIDTENFIGIDSVHAFVYGFPSDENKVNINDIIISDVRINGVTSLTEQELSGYTLHIDYSQKGNVLSQELSEIPLVAQLKVNGIIIKQGVQYYWFRENGTVFKESSNSKGKYSSFAGNGWECLNYYYNNIFVPKNNGNFIFTTSENDDLQNGKAKAPERNNKILCVAVYNGQWIRGQTKIINMAIDFSIQIVSSDRVIQNNGIETNRTIYYLDNGNPTFVCNHDIQRNNQLKFIWTVKNSDNTVIEKIETTKLNKDYTDSFNGYYGEKNVTKTMPDGRKATSSNDGAYTIAERLAQRDKNQYKSIQKGAYQKALNSWNSIKDTERVFTRKRDSESNLKVGVLYNFPISSVANSATISCAVIEIYPNKEVYLGTASIVLYNKPEIEGMYSLNLQNGSQVFQYDNSGNSPTSPQLQKPLVISPLTFTLIDNQGKEIPHSQIIQNGWIKWIVPKEQTLLITSDEGYVDGNVDLTVTRAELPLPASSYKVFNNLSSLDYSIANQYDSKKNINYVWLNVKFKDIILDAYTNFSFPKDGDPGTNGTDFVAKIVPITMSGIESETDRIYASNVRQSEPFFDDNGETIDKLKFKLYNNSVEIENPSNILWTAPPKGNNNDKTKWNTYIDPRNDSSLPSWEKKVRSKQITDNEITGEPQKRNYPVNIIRAQYKGDDINHYAEYCVCYNYLNNWAGSKYRFKIKPKTGFSYVVYQQDGTRPQYDNTMPFEIVVEKLNNSNYYEIVSPTELKYLWSTITDDLIIPEGKPKNTRFLTVEPNSKFSGTELRTGIACVITYNNTEIGYLHVPIYMIINRYGHAAINAWDGNSVQIDKDGDGRILAPQIGAGEKDSDNRFTGVLMGQIQVDKTDSPVGENGDIGIMGYHEGARSLFLDAKTGKAEFGKQSAAKIILDPSEQMNGKDVAFLYSNGFKKDIYKKNNGKPAQDAIYGEGLMIDLTSPAIQFGSGNFYVDANGHIHAADGGDIAGWNIDNNRFYKGNTGMSSDNYRVSDIKGEYPKDKDQLKNETVAFYAGIGKDIGKTGDNKPNFYVTHPGFLFSRHGRIASWDIDDNNLSNGNVGMGDKGPTIPKGVFYNVTAIDNVRFWSKTGSNANTTTFAVTANGKLYSKAGQIGPWEIGENQLTFSTKDNKEQDILRMGMGIGGKYKIYRSQDKKKSYNTQYSAVFWSNNNFAVDEGGNLYAAGGRIGNWHISKDTLWATDKQVSADKKTPKKGEKLSGIALSSNGSMFGGIGVKTQTETIQEKEPKTWDYEDVLDNKGKVIGKRKVVTEWKKKGKPYQRVIGITGGTWNIDPDGTATFDNLIATGGKIGSYTINDGSIYSNNGKIKLNKDGSIYAAAGEIGGFKITDSSISGGSLTLYDTGFISGGGWYIDANGNASFLRDFSAAGGSLTGGGGGSGSIGGNSFNGDGLNLSQGNMTSDYKILDKKVKWQANDKIVLTLVNGKGETIDLVKLDQDTVTEDDKVKVVTSVPTYSITYDLTAPANGGKVTGTITLNKSGEIETDSIVKGRKYKITTHYGTTSAKDVFLMQQTET